MRLSLFSVLLVSLLVAVSTSFVFAVDPASADVAGAQGSFAGDLASQSANAAGSAVSSQVSQIAAPILEAIAAFLRLVMLAAIVIAVVLFIWLIILLVTLRSIMRRDDLTGGEKTGWVIIAFFFGIAPLSIFGILLYWLSSWKKKKQLVS